MAKGSNLVRKKFLHRTQIFVVVFIIILLMTKICLHINPEWDPFKSKGLDGDNSGITNDNSPANNDSNIIDDNPSQVIEEENVKNDTSSHNDHNIINEEEEQVISSPKDVPFTIVTGASENHFCPLKSFLYTTHETIKGFKNAKVVVYDLGLSSAQIEILGGLQKKGFITELKRLDWSKYPKFWNISIARGEYAWKPGMIYEISNEYPGNIIWLDSGTKVKKSFFNNLVGFLKEYDGFVSPKSPGTMRTWTHKGVYEYFHDDHTKYDDLPNCNGAAIAFDTKRTQSLIDAWYQCALDKDCIAPPGSSRQNHRQDQALLTYFAAKEGRTCDQNRAKFGFHIHDDGNCKKEIAKYENEHDYI
ncbi:14559_t:CDS:2 [Funneliformis caledonium]|uniref:14559_t:CDS:1 n=1 Tax=Funneliformis caledonium TaxID=1117310 RepID=A0A9N8ZEL6_9GLOM|nr:14559_t:CDS:2 [Funneliformis caledonium]